MEGPNRVATAAAVAGLAHPEGTTRAVIATSVTAADALAATPLAGALDAALLLTRPDEVPAETAQALQDLGVLDITIVGGFQAISPEVEATLEQDYEVAARIAGDREWDTAANVAEQVALVAGLPQLAEGDTVFLANGQRFPDALASSAAAYAGPVPVLYTTADTLRPEVTQFLDEFPVDHVVLLGGEDAISDGVDAALQARGLTTTRLAGPTRVETSTQVANWTAIRFGFDLSTAILARGDDFPDALTSGQLGGEVNAPIVLSATPTVLPDTAEGWFADNCPTLEVVQAVGGTAALSPTVLTEAVEAAESCAAPPAEGPTFLVTPQEAVEVEAETPFEMEVVTRFDDQPFTGPVDIVLFPCANADVLGTGPDTFADVDGDGAADGFGSTDTGFARVALVNSEDIDDTAVVVGAEPDANGILSFTLFAAEPDCTVAVVIDGDGDGDFDVDGQGRPTEPYGVGVVSWSEPRPGGTQQTFIVDPQQPRFGPPGTTHEFGVGARYDQAPFTGPVDIVLFPCANADVLGSGPNTFADVDGDGAADGFGTTDTGFARIALVNDTDIDDTAVVVAAEPDADGVLDFTLFASEADCTVPVVVDGDGDGDLDVDAQGRPLEPYGVAYAEWGGAA